MRRNCESIQLVIHAPVSAEGKRSLAQQVASAHAEQVRRYVQSLNQPSERKKQLVNDILTHRR